MSGQVADEPDLAVDNVPATVPAAVPLVLEMCVLRGHGAAHCSDSRAASIVGKSDIGWLSGLVWVWVPGIRPGAVVRGLDAEEVA